jgi:hypothetical protein
VRQPAQLIVALGLVVTVAAGTLAGFGFAKWSHDSRSSSQSAIAATASAATTAMAEAGQLAVDFTSLDYRKLAQERAATAQHLTPAFAKVYLAQSKVTAKDIRKVKAVAVANVVATGLQAYSPAAGTANVLVAVDVTTKNVAKKAGVTQYYRFQIQLLRQGSQWLASNVVLR